MVKHKSEWIRVSKEEPCPVCTRGDYCTRTADGAMVRCMRITSPKESAKGGWIHRLSEPLPMVEVRAKEEQKRPAIDWNAEAKRMATGKRADEARLEVAGELGVTRRALESLWVGWGYDREWFSSWPERDAQGNVTGINRRYRDGRKKMARWGRHGLYYSRDWGLYPGPVFCPEGGSDVAALLTMQLPAVGRPSNIACADMLAELVAGRPWVIILGERDEKPERRGTVAQCPVDCWGCANCWPGLYGAIRTAESVRERVSGKVQAAMPRGAKDVRDWLKNAKRQSDMSVAEQFQYECQVVWE